MPTRLLLNQILKLT